MDTEKINIGILGVSGYGRTARNTLREAGKFNIVACIDTDGELLRAVAREENAKPICTMEDFLAFPGLDAVSINTPIPLSTLPNLFSV